MEMAHMALIGLSFHNAPLDVREKLSIGLALNQNQSQVSEEPQHSTQQLALSELNSRCAWLQEWVLLSTCNRIELYAAVAPGLDNIRDDQTFDLRSHLNNLHHNSQGSLQTDAAPFDVKTLMMVLLAEISGVEVADFVDYIYFYQDKAAAEHLLRVSTGLDSQVLGEPQILGQVNQAYMEALNDKCAGPVLTELFRSAIRTGKRVHTETTISKNAMNMSSMAIAQARRAAGSLQDKNCLVIGLGEMGRLACKQLQRRKVKNISVINRTDERAAQIAGQYALKAYRWEALAEAIHEADIVLSATRSAVPFITSDMIQRAMVGREDRPLFLLDVAVPRDMATGVRSISNVLLWDAGQLKGNLDEALAAREKEIPEVEHIIDQELETLWAGMRRLSVKPVVVRLREKAEKIRQQELERTLSHLGEVDEQTLAHFQFLSHSLVNKLLHDPTIRLKDKAVEEQANGYVQAINDLFNL